MIKPHFLQKLAICGVAVSTFGFSFQEKANAQFTVFFGEDLGLGETTRLPATPNTDAALADFLSQGTGFGIEDFETQTVGAGTPLSLTFPGTLNTTITATLEDSGQIDNIPTGTNGFGRYPTSGDQFFNDVSSELDIFFDQDIEAFGFKGIDVGDFGGQIIAEIKNDGSLIQSITLPTTVNAPGGGVLFFGIIGDNGQLFDEIDFLDTAPGVDFFGYDDMIIAERVASTPEPGTILGLLAIGSLGLSLKRKKDLA